MKAERTYPVDYIKKEPSKQKNHHVKESYEGLKKKLSKNLLKNIVMRIVLETRERKNRPKLSEVINLYR